jgi:hypothetical protein
LVPEADSCAAATMSLLDHLIGAGESVELVNLLISAFSDMSQIKDLGTAKTLNCE